MRTISKAEALDAGQRFAVWSFTNGSEFKQSVKRFVESLGAVWPDSADASGSEDATSAIGFLLEEALEDSAPELLPWFDTGRSLIISLNVVGRDTPRHISDAAVGTLRENMERSEIRPEVISKIGKAMQAIPHATSGARDRELALIMKALKEAALGVEGFGTADPDQISVEPRPMAHRAVWSRYGLAIGIAGVSVAAIGLLMWDEIGGVFGPMGRLGVLAGVSAVPLAVVWFARPIDGVIPLIKRVGHMFRWAAMLARFPDVRSRRF